ncbi:3-oxoacyl-[acyl-carrier protein] reductase [Virgibacillus natechei]|uniref:3-oxoacyl-[acyl-carrier protein] reductase n=1 Tax=Virgibacillus natechei TaxID=1216297 RepID=A0ABS4IIK6_9BACI|nr:SDR family oxidoreductase [Virgibacillus natechei]MBP1970769.1 3-oxoacyl-[acyl-carrier protein] reductase [Virgibacillus natechei]UZD12326.1 SDR family oxidoreductase [Virgibacillus natechei]
MQLEGKRIIITGGASGMAAATVRTYVKEGAIVASLDINDELGEQVVQEANEIGPGKATYFHCNIADRAEVKATFEKATKELGGLDVLAHVAAVQKGIPAAEITDEDYDFLMNINIRGTINTNQEAFNAMRDQGNGVIINYGSISGIRKEAGAALYSASKGAVMSWTRSIAAEWGPYGIRVNAVLPAINTPMYEEARANMTPEQLAENDAENKREIALGGKYGDPDEDLGPVMIFLASNGSKFITGQLLPVDGGQAAVR